MSESKIEYRVCWSASSNISFRGATDWETAEDWGETAEEVETALNDTKGGTPEGLEIALDRSGFEWWVETREAS